MSILNVLERIRNRLEARYIHIFFERDIQDSDKKWIVIIVYLDKEMSVQEINKRMEEFASFLEEVISKDGEYILKFCLPTDREFLDEGTIYQSTWIKSNLEDKFTVELEVDKDDSNG